MRRRNLFLCCTTLVVTQFFATQLFAVELRAGVSRINLTPPARLKAPLGGYGERMNAPAEGVHDRIFAKALVVTDGTKKFAMVTADMLGFPPPFKQAVIDRLTDQGWTNENLMLLASHSHASIEMNAINSLNSFGIPQIGIFNPELLEFTVTQFVTLIQQADKNSVAVRVGTTSQHIPGWNRNRRDSDGIVDDELTVTRIDRQNGSPLAVLVNFTAHPTFMLGDQMMFSGGWPGHMQRTVEAIIGDDVTVMYYNGAEGDQRPSSRKDAGSSRWEMAEHYGRNLGIVVQKQWQTVSTSSNVTFDYHRQTIELPKRTWHPDFMETGGKEYGLSEAVLIQMLPRLFPGDTASGTMRLGDLVVVGVPGEMAASLGLKIKAAAAQATGAKHAVIGGLADEWISYMLPSKEYDAGGYEASVSFYGRTLGPVIVNGAIKGVSQLKN